MSAEFTRLHSIAGWRDAPAEIEHNVIIEAALVFLRSLTILVAALACGTAALGQSSVGDTDTHRRAVELLRAGDYDTAGAMLRELHERDPENPTWLYDYIVALAWSQQDQAAVDLEPQLDPAQTPVYVIDALAKSARNARAYDTAVQWYERAIALEPENLDFRIGLSLSYAEAGDYNRANAVFAALPREQRNSPPVLVAQAYIQRLGGQLIAALQAYDRLLENNPRDFDALRGKALVLRDLLLPQQALDLAAEHPGILTAAEIERLEVDALAVQLRLTAETVYPAELDGILLDATIEQIDLHLLDAAETAAVMALEYDRIAALTERNEAEKAIAAFDDLDVPLEEIPAYVLAAAGKAYLQLKQPQQAVRLLELAILVPPVDIETELALIYAYLDVDRYRDAAALTDATLIKYPMLLRAADSSVIKGNEDRMRAEIVAAIAASSIDEHETAQARLEGLLADSPNNSDVRHELANVYRWRGWLERSLFEYDQVLTMDDSLVYARVGRANTLLDSQEFEEVAATLASLESLGNPDPIVDQLSDRWSLHNRSELQVYAQSGESSGDTFGSAYHTVDAYWFTRPISYNFRGFVHLHDSYAEFPEGDAQRRRAGVGTEYRDGPWSARGELLFDQEYSNLGVAGDVDWRMNDQWLLSAQVASNSSDTPLRGYRVGVESDTFGVSATLSMNESVVYSFGLNHADFSDGNRYGAVYGNLFRRVMTRPRSLAHLTAEIFTSRNSVENVDYYAPKRDLTVMVGAVHDWRIRRRYDRMLSQRASLQVGEYRQSGYGSGSIWRAAYALELTLSEALFVELGVQRARNRYDGIPEYSTVFLATVQARL